MGRVVPAAVEGQGDEALTRIGVLGRGASHTTIDLEDGSLAAPRVGGRTTLAFDLDVDALAEGRSANKVNRDHDGREQTVNGGHEEPLP